MSAQVSVAYSDSAARAASEMKLYAEIPRPCARRRHRTGRGRAASFQVQNEGGGKAHSKRARKRKSECRGYRRKSARFRKTRTLPQAASRGSGAKIPSARKARHIFRLSLFWRFFKKSACLKSSARYKIYLPQEASDTVSERGKSKISAKHVQLTEKGKLQCSTE